MADIPNITAPGREFDDYKLDEARGWIIERLNILENKINAKITEYFKPKEEEKFNKILLNSLIVGIGQKSKILLSLDLIDNKVFQIIQRLIKIRNAFAHTIVDVDINVSIESPEHPPIFDIKHYISYIDPSNGKIKTEMAKTLFDRFRDNYSDLREVL